MAIFQQLGIGMDKAKAVAKFVADGLQLRESRIKPYMPNGDEQRVLDMMKEPLRVRQATLEAFEPVWTKCILYTAGIQHIRHLSAGRRWEPVRVEDWVPLPVINEIQPKVARAVDFFTRKRPTAFVEPNTRSEEDIEAAELADAMIRTLWDKNDTDDCYDEHANWILTTGNTFAKLYVDTTLKMRVRIPQMQEIEEPVIDETGTPILNPETGMPVLTRRQVEARDPAGNTIFQEYTQGEVAHSVISPLSMTVPMAARKLSEAPWVMESNLYSSDHLRQMFPDKAEYIPERGRVLTSDLYVHRLTSILATGIQGVVRSVDPYLMEGFVLVNTLEVAPTPEFPSGNLLIEFDNIPLFIGDLPRRTAFSYEHAGFHRVLGRFWHRGMVEDAIHPQDQINKLEQYCQLNDAFNINPKTYVPAQANIAPGAIKNKPGITIEYNHPFKPETEPGTTLPPQIIQRRAMYQQDIEDVTGVRNVIMGNAPPGVTAGVALNRLGEEAEGMFDPPVKRFDRFVERCEGAKLELVARYYSIPRLLSVKTAENTVMNLPDFVGSQLRGNTRVKIEAGSARPRSKAGLQQMLLDTYDRGLLPQLVSDPGQYDEFMSQLGVSGFYTEQGLDYKRAKWENEVLMRMAGWEQVKRNSGDDDLVHLTTHTRFRKTPQFLRLPNSVQFRFVQHETEHLMAIIKAEGQKDPQQADEEAAMEADSGGGGIPPDGAAAESAPGDTGAEG